MAKIKSYFRCMICEQPLIFPDDMGIIDFIIVILQFYKNHEICEIMSLKQEELINEDVKVVAEIPQPKHKKKPQKKKK